LDLDVVHFSKKKSKNSKNTIQCFEKIRKNSKNNNFVKRRKISKKDNVSSDYK
jgi:hypothetical protein